MSLRTNITLNCPLSLLKSNQCKLCVWIFYTCVYQLVQCKTCAFIILVLFCISPVCFILICLISHRATTTLENKDGSQIEVKMRYTKLPPVCLDPGADTEAVDNPEGIVLMRGGVGREGTVLVLELENLIQCYLRWMGYH